MSTEKEVTIMQQKKLKYVTRSKGRTGKSKEYINKLRSKGCPNGRSKCPYCSRRTSITDRTRKEKAKRLCNCDENDIKDIKEDIRKDSEFIVVEKLNH